MTVRTKYTAWPTGEQDIVRQRIAAHRAADEIVQGIGWENGHGCAVGCSLDHYSHEEYSRVLGVSPEVAQLVDAIHEGLSPTDSLDWPMRVAEALVPGADVSDAWPRFAIWLLTIEAPSESGAKVANLYRRLLTDEQPTPEEWAAAAAAAAAEAAVQPARRS